MSVWLRLNSSILFKARDTNQNEKNLNFLCKSSVENGRAVIRIIVFT